MGRDLRGACAWCVENNIMLAFCSCWHVNFRATSSTQVRGYLYSIFRTSLCIAATIYGFEHHLWL